MLSSAACLLLKYRQSQDRMKVVCRRMARTTTLRQEQAEHEVGTERTVILHDKFDSIDFVFLKLAEKISRV